MTRDELDRLLRALARQRPFRQYWIEFFSGERLTAIHPEAVGPREGYFVFIGPDREYQFFGASAVCRVLVPLSLDRPSPR